MNKTFQSLWKRIRKRVKNRIRRSRYHVGVIVSHPKSGRTWLRVMLDELGLPVECTHDGVAAARSFEQLTLGRDRRYRRKPVLFMLRDPRDTVVSYYFHRTLRSDRYQGSMADFIRHPSYGIERIVRYNLTWLEFGSDLPAFMPITYETLKANPVDVMGVVIDFLKIGISRSDLERVCANNTFEKMRAREASGEYNQRYRRMLRPASENPDSYKVRRGKVGGYADYLTAEDIAFCDGVLGHHDYLDRLKLFTSGSVVQCS